MLAWTALMRSNWEWLVYTEVVYTGTPDLSFKVLALLKQAPQSLSCALTNSPSCTPRTCSLSGRERWFTSPSFSQPARQALRTKHFLAQSWSWSCEHQHNFSVVKPRDRWHKDPPYHVLQLRWCNPWGSRGIYEGFFDRGFILVYRSKQNQESANHLG